MLLRLEHNGRIIHELSSGAISGEIVIGRSHSCTWPVPKEDTVASSRHAALFRKGKAVWLKDLESSNGTFCGGKKIKKKKLALRDKVGIGNCVLCVEPEPGVEGKALSEVVVRSGKARGQKKQLVPPVFTIGSDPSSNLVFLDLLVSRRHAEISVKEDGSCWIRDLGSKNGSSVNGMPLRDDKERLLKDGDRIAFSHLEIEFHDGAVKRSNKQAWLRLGILAMTLVAGLSSYQAYQKARPSAETFIRNARRLAAQENFSAAAQEVNKASNARHAASNQVTLEELRRLLGVWGNTVSLWQRSQQALEKGKWTQVSRDLGMLQATKKDAWEWNEKAVEEKENAFRAKDMLDALLRAEASIGREDIGFDVLVEDHDGVVKALAGLGEKTPPYLALLKTELEMVEARQAGLLGESQAFESALDALKQDTPIYSEIVSAVGQACVSKEEGLKRRAQVVQPAVQALARSFNLLTSMSQQVKEMEIQKALAEDLLLPSTDTCAIDPRLSQARQTIEKNHQNLKLKTGQLGLLFGEIEKRIGREGDNPPEMIVLQDQAVMSKVLACDSLDAPLPRRSRKEPLGEYDRVLGVEEFYEHLAALPEAMNPVMVADLSFVPVLAQARDVLQRIDTLTAFMMKPDNQWMNAGKLAQQMTRLNAILIRREGLVRAYVSQAETATGRAALIAGGIVVRLSGKSAPVMIKGQPCEAWLAAELKSQRSVLQRLSGEYNLADPARQIAIRNEILKSGLPGDPVVRNMWSKRDASVSAR